MALPAKISGDDIPSYVEPGARGLRSPGTPGAPSVDTGGAPSPSAASLAGSGRLESVPAASRQRELTPRAIALGCAIGAVLAAGNVYTGLKTGFIDTGAMTATLVSFTAFAALRRFGPRTFTPLENNIAQTVAASAAVMALVHGFAGPVPALALMGQAVHPAWSLWAWGLALGLLGVLVGLWSRRKLIVEDALPFPSGVATAELIRALHVDRHAGVRPIRLLGVASLLAAIVAWGRDGHAAWLPQALYLPMAIAGLSASGLTVGVAVSPLMAATGVFVGLRSAATLAVTGAVAWGVLAPVLVRTHLIPEASYTAIVTWLMWPAFGMMLGGTIGPLLVGARRNVQVLRRTLADVRNLGRGLLSARSAPALAPAPGTAAAGQTRRDGRGMAVVFVLALALLVFTGVRAFGLSVGSIVAAVVVAVALAGVCARAAGETDIAPVGNMGTLTQLLFARGGPGGSILAGSITTGNATQTSQTLWALKGGQLLGASVRAQALAQLIGVVLGSLVVVPTYLAVARVNPLGTERMPAVGALSWRATAEAVAGGLSGLPPHGLHGAAVAFALGLVLSAASRGRAARFLPSPVAIGIALIAPMSMTTTMLMGAAAVALVRRRWSSFTDADAHALGAGALAGESVVGVLLAVLASAGFAP
jgi:putative OPT family oligopeptide transporter